MESFHERLCYLIDCLNVKKVEFAEKIKVDQSFISQLCSGKRNPSDRTISDICRAYHVNETWLKNGEGGESNMFLPEREELGALLGTMLHGEADFKERFLAVLLRMSPEEWAILERKALELVAEMEKGKKEAGPEGPAAEK